MIKKFKIFESIKDEYPFVEKRDLHDIVPSYFIDDDSVDTNGLNNKLERIFLNNWCEFYGKDHNDNTDDYIKIKGLVTKASSTYFYDPMADLEVLLTVDGVEFEVDHLEKIFVHLKEERKSKKPDKDIDPYEEEDWED